MSKGLLFWVLMILWLVFGIGLTFWPTPGPYIKAGPMLLEFVLFGLLGWAVFGPAIK
jgi:hypothetical protein